MHKQKAIHSDKNEQLDMQCPDQLFYLVYALLHSVHRKPSPHSEWYIHVVTLVFAITILLLNSWCVFIEGPWPFTNLGEPNTPFQTFVITVCLGYFLLDLPWCLYFCTEGPVMLLHHVLSIAGFSLCIVYTRWGTEIVGTVLLTELTNPFLQWHWFLLDTGKSGTSLGTFVDVTFMVLFGVLRIGVGTFLVVYYYSQDTGWWGRFGGTAIYLIGWSFWVDIMQHSIKEYKKIFGKVPEAKKLPSRQ